MYRLLPTALLSLGVATAFAQDRGRQSLDIYVVDVEGGNATLFVSPSGESLLIDTGNAGARPRETPTASWRPSRTPV